MKSFKKQLEFYKNKINLELAKYFELKILEAAKISPFCERITRSLANYTLRGGNRIRSFLFIYGHKSIIGKISEEIIKASLSMELIQSSLLVHDDIIDQDNLRRGGPTIHYEYGKKDKHFGESIAIIAGDLAFNFAYEIIDDSKFENSCKIQALKLFLSLVTKVNYGQVLDIIPMNSKTSQKDVDLVHMNKTASYTGELPLLVGATLAGADKNLLKTLDLFAKKIGQAFQIQDDMIGIFGNEKETGKPADSDIREGKKTLLIVKALEKANDNEKKIIINCLGNNKGNEKEIQEVRKIIYKIGSLDYSIEKAKKLISEAIKIIKPAKIDPEAKEFLINLAKYILVKDKIIIPK